MLKYKAMQTKIRRSQRVRSAVHIAIVGIDGSGKSSSYDRLIKLLATDTRVAGIGDSVLVSADGGKLAIPRELIHVRIKAGMSLVMRLCRHRFLYQISKLLELIERNKVHGSLENAYHPEIIITDGSPLITMLGWARHHHPQHFSEKEYSRLIYFLTKRGRLTIKESLYYLRRIPELYVIRNIYNAQLRIPDKAIFLKTDVSAALARINPRGLEQKITEQGEFLEKLQTAYEFVLKILKKEYGLRVYEVDTGAHSLDEVVSECFEVALPGEEAAQLSIIAGEMNGSLKERRRLDALAAEFRKSHQHAAVVMADSSELAFKRAKAAIVAGGKWLIAAGGAETFNSVLEGSCAYGAPPDSVRLAYLRRGAADLVGKMLSMPDGFKAGARVISEAIKQDKAVESDIVELYTQEDGRQKKYHMIGYAGVGIFGDIPYFTESRLAGLSKGVFERVFGYRGPFVTGANLAIARHYLKRRRDNKLRYNIVAQGRQMSSDEYATILIVNGDLGRHFPVARGVPLDSGDFQVVLFKEGGLRMTCRQILHAWKGDLFKHRAALGVEMFRTGFLKIIPEQKEPYHLNMDGLLKEVHGEIEFSLYGKIRLITG